MNAKTLKIVLEVGRVTMWVEEEPYPSFDEVRRWLGWLSVRKGNNVSWKTRQGLI